MAYACRHNRARVYHVQHKALYRAIGVPDSHFRRPLSAARVAEGLMTVDALLAMSDVTWLATDHERAAAFSAYGSGKRGGRRNAISGASGLVQ